MASENIISFDVTNWITVTLMAAIGFVALGAAIKIIKNRGAAGA